MRRIAAEDAAERLQGIDTLDPSGLSASALELARAGQAYEVEGEGGRAVFVVAVRNGCAFVVAAKGSGALDMTAALDHVVTTAANNDGLAFIGLQTARPGLVRKLERRGFEVTGWIMRKKLQ